MLKNKFNRKDFKNECILLGGIFVIFVIMFWLLSPPSNKLQQFFYAINNLRYNFAQSAGTTDYNEYLFHKNNAVYLAKMYPDTKVALAEIDKAIESLPRGSNSNIVKGLYRDRANIKLYLGEYKAAISDFAKVRESNSIEDKVKIAMLFLNLKKYNHAMTYCNMVHDTDPKYIDGFACIAEVYKATHKKDLALNVWDRAVSVAVGPSKADAYMGRAFAKKDLGDLSGFEEDIKNAKEYSPFIKLQSSLYDRVLNPDKLDVSSSN